MYAIYFVAKNKQINSLTITSGVDVIEVVIQLDFFIVLLQDYLTLYFIQKLC